MRSLSGTRNRFVLVVAGLIAVAVGAWLGAAAFGLPADSTMSRAIPAADETIAMVVESHRQWLLPVSSVIVVIAVLAGLVLLAFQIPTAPERSLLRVTDEGGTVMARLEAPVLERALAERVESLPGVESTSVRVSGTMGALSVHAEITIVDGAELEWAIGQARQMIAADLSSALGSPPTDVDLLVRLQGAGSGRGDRDRAALRQDGHGKSVSDAV